MRDATNWWPARGGRPGWLGAAGSALCVGVLATASVAVSAGPTYKCMIDGRTVFQQTGCPANSQPEPAKGASAPASAMPAPTSHAPGRANAASAPTPTVSASATSSSAERTQPIMRSGTPLSRASAASSVHIDIPRK